FRHITAYLNPYPKMSLREAINQSKKLVLKMKQDWQPKEFAAKFEQVFQKEFIQSSIHVKGDFVQLQIKKNDLPDLFFKRLKKYKRKIKQFSFKNLSQLIRKDEII